MSAQSNHNSRFESLHYYTRIYVFDIIMNVHVVFDIHVIMCCTCGTKLYYVCKAAQIKLFST